MKRTLVILASLSLTIVAIAQIPYRGKSSYRSFKYIKKTHKQIKKSDFAFITFPKSGRTWTRFFLSKYEDKLYKMAGELEPDLLTCGTSLRPKGAPKIHFSHNYFNDLHQNFPGNPKVIHEKLLSKKQLIILVRDPRDVAVSYYHQKADKEQVYDGSMEDFILSDIYGIERQSIFVNKLMDFYTNHDSRKLILTYEALRANPKKEFTKLVEFIYGSVDPVALDYALAESSFNSMRKYEVETSQKENITKYQQANRLGFKNWDGNMSALKTRKGKVGGHRDELDNDLTEKICHLQATQALLKRMNLD